MGDVAEQNTSSIGAFFMACYVHFDVEVKHENEYSWIVRNTEGVLSYPANGLVAFFLALAEVRLEAARRQIQGASAVPLLLVEMIAAEAMEEMGI